MGGRSNPARAGHSGRRWRTGWPGRLRVALALAVVLASGAIGWAEAGSPAGAQAGPGGDPSFNLPDNYASSLAAVNAGRADDGLGPLAAGDLAGLSPAQEMFVIIDLERVARSLPPVQEMTATLDDLAQVGANTLEDPAPAASEGTSFWSGGIEAGVSDPLIADFGWMYEDGCGIVLHQAIVNVDCQATPPRPWGHRDIILYDFATGPDCTLALGAAVGQRTPSIAVEFSDYCGAPAPSDAVYTWAEAEARLGMTTSPGCGAVNRTLGYRMVASDGGVFDFGDYPFCGSASGETLHTPVVGMATTPDKGGYWLAASDGGVFAFGDAPYDGSMADEPLVHPVVGIAGAPFGNGYWLVASDGGVFAFGSARFYGSMGGTQLRAPVVGMAVAPFGLGYWLVASDGGVFAFGSARFYGSMGGAALAQPVVGMAAAPLGLGYWLVASDGGVFAFGVGAFYGSTGGSDLAAPVVGMGA